MTRPAPTILLVEDNAADASLLLELLEGVEPAVRALHVGTGERALAHLHGQVEGAPPIAPQLVLMDLKLPGRSGQEILAAIRAAPPLRRLPVVILSTSDAPRDVDGCYEAGANAYLVKSSDPDELAERVGLAIRFFCATACLPTPLASPAVPPAGVTSPQSPRPDL